MKSKKIKQWKQIGSTTSGNLIFSNDLEIVPVPILLVESIRKDAYDLGVEVGKKLEQGNLK